MTEPHQDDVEGAAERPVKWGVFNPDGELIGSSVAGTHEKSLRQFMSSWKDQSDEAWKRFQADGWELACFAPQDAMEEAAARIEAWLESDGLNPDDEIRALLTDWRQRGEVEDRLHEEIVALRNDLEAEAAALSEALAVLGEATEALIKAPKLESTTHSGIFSRTIYMCPFCLESDGHTADCIITRATAVPEEKDG